MVRKGMLQLWDDLEHAAEGMGVAFKVINVRKTTANPLFDSSGLVDFKGRGPKSIRCNSVYRRSQRAIIMRFQPDFTPAYKAAIFAHEIGHHMSQEVFDEYQDKNARQARKREEIRANLHAYELLYQLTRGRVPLGCIDMLNISLASYVGKEEQL